MHSQRLLHAAVLILFGSNGVAATLPAKPLLNPGYHHADTLGFLSGPAHDAVVHGLAAGTIQTLPNWTQPFRVEDQEYSYTLLGTDPAAGSARTVIPTVIVPIRLVVPDYRVDDKPLVLDATPLMPRVLGSPLFQSSAYDSGYLQFADAMLHATFPSAPAHWHLIFAPTVAPTLEIVAPKGSVQVAQTKSGRILGVVTDGRVLDDPIVHALRQSFSPQSYVIFVSYNSLFSGAFGYHSALLDQHGTGLQVFTYTSWLEGVDSLFKTPSPNADTLAHEVAEVVHDAFGTSLTREWGDWFGKNKCFQRYIEVGDAVEDASARVQNWVQAVTTEDVTRLYTVQVEALLPWFTREYPSSALHRAYSFPDAAAVLGPAPLDCRK